MMPYEKKYKDFNSGFAPHLRLLPNGEEQVGGISLEEDFE